MSISLDITSPLLTTLQEKAWQLGCLPNVREPAASTDLENSLGGGLGLLRAKISSFGIQSTVQFSYIDRRVQGSRSPRSKRGPCKQPSRSASTLGLDKLDSLQSLPGLPVIRPTGATHLPDVRDLLQLH